ncbi:RNA polymerase subunit sigma-24 [Paenibacillus sp. PK3_47]|uniref:sigma-70 family RNA polymerase sigma factor n=1 Tax=Paenibacillus sp. PK3_47 TaxID=2072642 RepID=UPI00201E3081|nr:sigma-70 family RNA polymerase sigma factor [Paenibacillus sp. PK3_47]UQZ35271.1 RNA polymerase subunit sigma-24 [Paenibacillus sp. PK3_47]
MKPNSLDDHYQSYVHDIYRYLYALSRDHHLAEDLMQETFYRAYLYLEDCREDRIKPWLFRVAYNAFIDYTRKASRSITTEAGFFNTLPHPETTESVYMRRERMEALAASVGELPEAQRHALLLHDFHGMSYKDAAAIMDVSLPKYKILVFRARQRLREEERRRNGHE